MSGSGSQSGTGLEPQSGRESAPRSGALTATLVSRAVIAPGIVDLVLAMRSPDHLQFRAGQFVSITVGKGTAGNAGNAQSTVIKRSYSIASPATQGDRLRFIVRVIPEGTGSPFLMDLPLGAEVPMTGPHGFFVLDAEHPGDIVFGATGTGVAAVMPMLVELAQRSIAAGGGRRVLYWGAREQEDLVVRPEIEALCREASCSLKVFLTSPPPEWSEARGRITAAIVADLPGFVAPTFYLVGNGAMISELKGQLVALGVNRKKQVRTEAYFD